MNRHLNNFDFLRLLAAGLVLFSHQQALMGQVPIAVGGVNLGTLGVLIFFAISGYLVSQSWHADPHPGRFALKRFLRIWPGLAVVTVLAALVLGPLVSSLDVATYFRSPEWVWYFKTLLMSVQYHLPGVFADNPHPAAVNGSLWTIPLEVKWYVVLCAAGCLRLLKWRWLVTAAFVGLVIFHFLAIDPNYSHFREYGMFFVAGSVMYLFRDWWQPRPWLLAVVALLAGMVVWQMVMPLLGVLVALPPLVVIVGEHSAPVLRRFGRFGDLSYGTYIYAFPVQQTLIWKFGASGSFVGYVLATTVITLICAWLSWHLVERPALSLKRRLRSRRRLPEPEAAVVLPLAESEYTVQRS